MRMMRIFFTYSWLLVVVTFAAMLVSSGCGAANQPFTPLDATMPSAGEYNSNRAVNWARFALVTDPGMFHCRSRLRDCGQVADETRAELLSVLSHAGIDIFELRNRDEWKRFGRPHHLLEVTTTEDGGVDDYGKWVGVRVKVRVVMHERIDAGSEAIRQVAVFTGSYNMSNFAAGVIYDHAGQAVFNNDWEDTARTLATEALIEAVRRLRFGENTITNADGKQVLDPKTLLTSWVAHYAHDTQQKAIADAVKNRNDEELEAAAEEQRNLGRAKGETRLEVLRRRNAELSEELAHDKLMRYQQGEPIPEQPVVEQPGTGGTTVIVVDPSAPAPEPPLPLGPQNLSPQEEALIQQLEQLQRQAFTTERQLAALQKATPDQRSTAAYAAHEEALVKTLEQIQGQIRSLEGQLHVIQELPQPSRRRR